MQRLLKAILLPMLLLAVTVVSGQNIQVTGKVTDAKDGSPLAGVSIVVKGTPNGTSTGSDGSYSIRIAANGSLVFSFVGYTTQTLAVSGNSLNVALEMNAAGSTLMETVVIGYGTQRKKDLTGAVATVSNKDFVKGAIQTPEQLIAGKVAGVQVTPNSGAPGSGSTIRIRGGASLNASNDPLIVIDGVPVDNRGAFGSSNPLNLINPNDIETFTVLKDPSAAAIYGSRASNGVILITTKKGKKGKVRWNFNGQAFAQTPAGKVDVMSADEIRQIVKNQGSSSDQGKLGTTNTDWQDEIFRTAWSQDLNLSASGTWDELNIPFRISGGFLNQNGILETSNFKRETISLNLNPKALKDKLKIDVNYKFAHTSNRFADEGAVGTAASFDPTQPVKVNSPRFGGYFEYIENTLGLPPQDLAPRNPVGLLTQRQNNSDVFRHLGNIQLDYSLPWIKGLRANLNAGFDYQTGSGTTVMGDSAASTYRRWETTGSTASNFKVLNYGGENNTYKSQSMNTVLEFYLNYVKDLKSINSKIDVMAGTSYQDFWFWNPNYADYRYNFSQMPNSQPAFPASSSEYTLISYYGRLNYTLANKYVLTGTLRTDGTSKFGPDQRWGLFPSAAFAWRVSEENFLKNSSVLSDLKFRVGYGVTGQQDGISYYGYIPRYSLSNDRAQYQLGNEFSTMYRPSAYDPNLKWETTTNINMAVDFGFWANRLSGSIDVFKRTTNDLLSVVPIALGTNFSNELLTNVGNIESNGAEITINVTPIKNSKVTWDFSFNATYIDPKITKLLLNPDPDFKGNRFGGVGGGTGNTIRIHSVDYRPGAFYVLKQVYDANGKPIEGLYEDQNRDGVINDDDYYRYQNPDPKYFMGFSTNVTAGRFNAGFVARANIGNYVYNGVQSNRGVYRSIVNPLGWINNGSTNYLETGFLNNQYFSDYYVKNASFFRMDNISIGYDMGEISKGVRLRLSGNVQNAFVITQYDGLDPEVGGGIDNTFYPRPRTYVLGVNLDF
jgi:iron complex outermembrane receptor protein